ncbi:hypothetical protein LTS03_006877 [Exophiala xenobiotica]|nr:hypothetical protein LTR41_006541 [Exophiala xenobiotica]KAK5245215.1 hypothetical protein LTS06_009310 [Exophiala xenobiotica]KAK5347789.1 hypothetical protein LTR61_008418 [Exophiala xenobiotica]KAK5369746.1 hypothetical protein LTR11_007078 [Exophiala xenobiotica]KAK5371779.1 hypothetical protein LTS03_006877 [Exophiala xenobiotica]
MASVQPALEPAAGFSLESAANRPDRVPLQKGQYSIASRAVALSTYFLSGALAINLSQFLGAPLALVNEDWYNAWIAFTKQSFGLLTMTLTQTFAPTKVIVSGDASVRGQLLKSVEGDLILDFPERLVLIANHQIYTDWLYLWWIAYCNGMHGRLYIILKESLKKIPILGWGMQFNQFIFLKRNWEQDRPNMATALQKLNKITDPMWLLLFPEGTNLAPSTRAKSAAWAKKNNISDTRHVLLPRSTGLHFCLEQLKDSVDYVYDCTVAYEGVPRGQYAQDIFTLKSGYLEGRPPKSVSMHWRRFLVKDIPLHNEKAFELWLLARWREKDVLIEQWYQTGRFPADVGVTKYKSGKTLRGCGLMEVPIRSSHWYEFLQIFAPMGILAMVLYIFYGDLPQKFWKSINKQALQSGTEDVKKAGLQATRQVKSASTSLGGLTLDSFFDPDQQKESFKAGAMAVQKLINSPSAQVLLNRADFIQQFLSDPQGMVTESITNKQQNFMQQLGEEEARRQQRGRITGVNGTAAPLNGVKRITNGASASASAKKGGTFWSKLDAEEKSRQDSVVSAGKKQMGTGTFWKDLEAAETKRTGPSTTISNLKGKGNFWDDLKTEENSRYGTVVTLSSDASTAVASNASSTSTKGSVSKLGPRKAAAAGLGQAQAQARQQGNKISSSANPNPNPVPTKTASAKKTPAAVANGSPIKAAGATTVKKPNASVLVSAPTPAAPKSAPKSKPVSKQAIHTPSLKPVNASKSKPNSKPAGAPKPKLSSNSSNNPTATPKPKPKPSNTSTSAASTTTSTAKKLPQLQTNTKPSNSTSTGAATKIPPVIKKVPVPKNQPSTRSNTATAPSPPKKPNSTTTTSVSKPPPKSNASPPKSSTSTGPAKLKK